MTQGYTPSIETIIDVYASARANAMRIQLSDEWNREHKRIVNQAMGTLAAHDAQIRAEAVALSTEELAIAEEAAFIHDECTTIYESMRRAFKAVAEHRKEQKQ